MDNKIYKLILHAQQGDETSLLQLLDIFSPLITNLSFRLSEKTKTDREDIQADLQLYFIILIKRIKLNYLESTEDGVLTAYIVKSMRRIKHTKFDYSNEVVRFEDLSPAEVRKIEFKYSLSDSHDNLLLDDLREILTPKEYRIIKETFFNGRSITEIAHDTGTTRQAVNQIKLRALRKLKKNL